MSDMTEKRFKFEWAGAGVVTIIDTTTNEKILASDIVNLLNSLNDENEQFKSALKELKEIDDYFVYRNRELNNENEQLEKENEQLKQELGDVIEICRKYGIYKEELKTVLYDYDKMLKDNGERAIRYKYCVNGCCE